MTMPNNVLKLPNSDVDKYSFVIETFKSFRGRSLRSIKPDSDGYYNGVPIAVIGIPSDNRAFYEPESFVRSLNQDPFHRKLTMGGLNGEVQHPDLPVGKLGPNDLKRLFKIDQTLVSTYFRKIYLAEKLETGGRIVRADMKPHGPYGQYTEEKLNDPNMGYAASLRAACSERYDPKSDLLIRTIGQMVTFDNADSGGYIEASKYYIGGTESIEINMNDYYVRDKESGRLIAACEEVKDLEILKIFGVKEMIWETKSYGIQINDNTYVDETGRNTSIYHNVLSRIRG